MPRKKSTPETKAEAQAKQQYVWQTHPLYKQFWPTWKLLSEVYEGDGGFLDGSNLVPHPRELLYPKAANGEIDTRTSPTEKDKFKRRKALARYENFAQSIVDVFVDHQYVKGVTRQFEGLDPKQHAEQPIVQWWKDVDGLGTCLDDWMKQTQVMADVFGHVFVVLDREPPDGPVLTAADEKPLYLRVYTPLDAPDWLAPRRKLTAIKFIEAVERESLQESSVFSADTASGNLLVQEGGTSTPHVQYRIWTKDSWTILDHDGNQVLSGEHGYGELPVIVFYSRRRPRIPILGRPLLRDPKLFKDHYNLVSELRELVRSQCFSMLHIQLGEGEEVADARARLGDHAGTDTILWTKAGAEFIAAPDGPAATLMKEIENVEAKMFQLIGVSQETDSHAPETEGSRRLKAMDLNRLLAGCATEAQRFEEQLARLWYIGTYGQDAGKTKWTQAKLSIKHPSEFYVEAAEEAITRTLAALEVPLGKRFSAIVRKRAVNAILPELSPEDVEIINGEIDELIETEGEQDELAAEADAAEDRARADLAGQPTPVGGVAAPAPPKAKGKGKPKAEEREAA